MYVLLLTVLCKLVSSCNILPSFTQNSVGVFLQQSALSKIYCRRLISCDELHLVHPVNCLQPKTGCGIITVGILTALEIIVIGNWMYNNYYLINVGLIYGAFATLRKAIVSFIMYVCLSVCLSVTMEQLGFYQTDFLEILYLFIFGKSFENFQVSLKSANNNRYFT